MSRHVLPVNYVDVLPVLGAAIALPLLRLARVSVPQWCAQAALTITGHLRPRPPRSVEHALQTAFAELDKDLAALLGDRNPRRGSR